MEFFRFCLEIIRREAKRFNVGIKNSTVCQLTAATANDINYDDAYNRCAFLYRCGTINLSFAKDCFSKFLSDYNIIEYLLSKWGCDRYLTFCSISKGPALDCIALLLCNEQCKTLASLIGNLRIITKHGAWRNTANIMLEVVNEGYFKQLPPLIGTIEVIQGDPFDNFTDKVKLPINDSDVVMMVKTLNLQSDGYDQEKVCKSIQDFLDTLKPGAVLFCIDTKPSIKEITQALTPFSGKFLLKPTPMNTIINLEYTDLYKAQFECLPIVSGRGCFFVWEKSSVSISNIQCELNATSDPVKNELDVADNKSYNKVRDELIRLEHFPSINRFKKEQELKKKQDSLKYIANCCTPKSSEKSSEGNCNLKKKDLLLADNVNSFCEKSSCPLPFDSSVYGSISSSSQSLTSLNLLKSELDPASNTSSLKKSSCPLPSDSSSVIDSVFNASNFTMSNCPLPPDSSSVSESTSFPCQFEAGSINSLNSLKCDLNSISNSNNFEQSNCPLSSINRSVSPCNHLKANRLQSLLSLKSQLDLVSNKCLQAIPELSKATEIAKITELTNKITDLTVELTKLLENNALKDNATNSCFRCSVEMYNHLDTEANFCSNMIPCRTISSNFKTCCCCQKCAYHHFHLSSSHASLCDKTSDCCRSSEKTRSSAQIVIPLNNLPTNIISQIISLITESNHEQ